MKANIFVVDAFASRSFEGNPTMVAVFDEWPGDDIASNVARENQGTETAVVFPSESTEADYAVRWYLRDVELDMCGHAALGVAHVAIRHLGFQGDAVRLLTRKGVYVVNQHGDELSLPLNPWSATELEVPPALSHALRRPPSKAYQTRDLMAVFDKQEQVATLRPDLERIEKLETFGVIATAPGEEDVDFVSRFFAPRVGVPEDAVSCSAHRTLVPYWANQLGKTDLIARQLSPRGGTIHCRLLNGQVFISGRTSTYLEGKLTIQ